MNPKWTDFVNNYTHAVNATRSTNSRANARFVNYWYGQPRDYEKLNQLHEHLQTIFVHK